MQIVTDIHRWQAHCRLRRGKGAGGIARCWFYTPLFAFTTIREKRQRRSVTNSMDYPHKVSEPKCKLVTLMHTVTEALLNRVLVTCHLAKLEMFDTKGDAKTKLNLNHRLSQWSVCGASHFMTISVVLFMFKAREYLFFWKEQITQSPFLEQRSWIH